MSPEELLAEAQRCGVRQMVLTDINTTAGCLNFVRLAEATNIRPLLGIDFRNGAKQQFIGVAKDNEGFNLSQQKRFMKHGCTGEK